MDFRLLENDEFRLELTISINNNYYYKAYKKDINEHIGNFGIRLEKNEENYYLGNIEYEVFDEFRGHHYAEKVTKLLTNIAVDKEVDDLYITADPKNLASIKTIEHLGAKFLEVAHVPNYMKLYRRGYKEIAVYNLNVRK